MTGGSVYRGAKWPELDGVYIYGDYSTGRIWGAKHDGEQMVWHRELADTQLGIASFTAVKGGDFLVTDQLGNAIYQLVKNKTATQQASADFPRKLSETGLFRLLGSTALPHDGVHAYEVNAPGWNDGANTYRWMAVPVGKKVSYADQTPWGFPDGTALVQTLSFDGPIETRVSLRQQGEWAGFSYRWNKDGTDAELVPKGGADATLSNGQKWHFPSRTECAVCHNRAVNYVLGINGAQLKRKNQLNVLAE